MLQPGYKLLTGL